MVDMCLTQSKLVCWSPVLGPQQSQAVLRCKVKCLFPFGAALGLRPALVFDSKRCIHVFLQSVMNFGDVSEGFVFSFGSFAQKYL